MQQITRQQIDTIIRQIEHHESVVERFKEHPQYVQYQELVRIQKNGMFIAHTLASEEKLIEELKQQAGQMINIMNQQQQQPMPQSMQQPMQQQSMLQQQRPRQAAPQQQQRPVSPQPRQQNRNIDAFGNPIPQQPQPHSAPPVEHTPEQQAEELFRTTQEEIGIDEQIEGLPDIEDLPEFEEQSPQ